MLFHHLFIKGFVLCVIAIAFGVIYYNAEDIIELTDIDEMLPYIDSNKESFNQFHRYLAANLLEAGQYIDEGKILKALLEIRTVVGLLDHRYQSSLLTNSFMVKANPQESNSKENNSEDLKFRFNTSLLDFEVVKPDFNLISNTTSTSLSDVNHLVTVLVDICGNHEDSIRTEEKERLISQIRKQWNKMKILLITKGSETNEYQRETFHNDNITEVSCDKWKTSVKTVLGSIGTPFTLVLFEPLAVTPDLNITRLLNAMTQVKVIGVIGFAERGKDAGWDYTCSQLKFRGPHLSIINGYEYSKEACFFCDVTSNSFLVDTSLYKKVLPDVNLSLEIRKIDWFIRLQELNVWTMTCPDIMLHTLSNVTKMKGLLTSKDDLINSDNECYPDYEAHKSQLKELAKKHNLTSITLQNKSKVKFIYENEHL